MKILHYLSTYLTPSETFIARYIQASNGWAAASVMSSKINSVKEEFRGLNDIPVFKLYPQKYSTSSFSGLVRYVTEKTVRENLHTRSIRKVLKNQKPDIVHCHFGPRGIMFNKALKEDSSVPFVVSFYGYDATKKPLEDPGYKKSLVSLFNSCSGIFVEGPHFCQKLKALGAPEEKVYVNPIVIPVKNYPQKESVYQRGGPITFLLAGRFVEKKGFHLFLENIGGIKDELPEFSIQIIGDGPLKGKYQKIIQKYDLSKQAKFLGWKNHESLLEYIKKADFFVHPSVTASDGDTEGGAPTILLEAQAIKTPIISSKHADIPYIMGYDDFLCEEGDLKSLKSVITKAVNSDRLPELVNQGYQKILSQHDLSSKVYRKNIEELI